MTLKCLWRIAGASVSKIIDLRLVQYCYQPNLLLVSNIFEGLHPHLPEVPCVCNVTYGKCRWSVSFPTIQIYGLYISLFSYSSILEHLLNI